MLRWCSYCQQFLGEVAPYDNFAITHGICPACTQGMLADEEPDLSHALVLQGLQDQFYEAGRRNDFKAVERIIEDSDHAKMRTVDLLVGVMAPLLYRVGEEWKQGAMSVAEEHRFTAFCEKTFEMIYSKVANQNLANQTPADRAEAVLINVSGNSHTLGIRILALWLLEKGISTWVFDGTIGNENLVMQIRKLQPSMVLISVALAEQAAGVLDVVERITSLPNQLRPRIFVGGYAVKQGLISAIPGAQLVTDISSLLQGAPGFAGLAESASRFG